MACTKHTVRHAMPATWPFRRRPNTVLGLVYSRPGLAYTTRAWRLMRHSIALREPGLTDAVRVNPWGISWTFVRASAATT